MICSTSATTETWPEKDEYKSFYFSFTYPFLILISFPFLPQPSSFLFISLRLPSSNENKSLTPFAHSFIHLVSFTSPYCFKSPLFVQLIFTALPVSQKRIKVLWDLTYTLAMEFFGFSLCVTFVDTFIGRLCQSLHFLLQMVLNFLHKQYVSPAFLDFQ